MSLCKMQNPALRMPATLLQAHSSAVFGRRGTGWMVLRAHQKTRFIIYWGGIDLPAAATNGVLPPRPSQFWQFRQ